MKTRKIILLLLIIPINLLGQITFEININNHEIEYIEFNSFNKDYTECLDFEIDNHLFFTIEKQFDSIQIGVQDHIPIVISGIENLHNDTILIEIEEIFQYIAFDTIIYGTTKKKKLSKRLKNEEKITIENNSLKLSEFPESISIRINLKDYVCYLTKKRFFSITMGDGRNFSSQEIIKGVDAKYRLIINNNGT